MFLTLCQLLFILLNYLQWHAATNPFEPPIFATSENQVTLVWHVLWLARELSVSWNHLKSFESVTFQYY